MHGFPVPVGCQSINPVREVTISGIYNPWARNWVCAYEQDSFGQPLLDRAVSDRRIGYKLFDMDVLREAQWMQVDIRAVGTVIFPRGQPIPPLDQDVSAGIPNYPGRVRVTWMQIGQKTASWDITPGAGVSFPVPPTFHVAMDFLIPDPDTNDVAPVPSDFDPNAWMFASTLRAYAIPSWDPDDTKPPFSQTIFVASQATQPPGQQIIVPPGARSVQAFASPAAGNDAVPSTMDLLLRFTQEYVRLEDDVVVPPPFDASPTVDVPFVTPYNTERVVVPDGFDTLRIRTAPINTIRRNVTLVWKLS